MKSLEKSSEKFVSWFCQHALPVWAENGYNHSQGGFFEALDFHASPIMGKPRRVRSQARQIHSFSQAGLRHWNKDAESIAAKGFEYFTTTACPDMGKRGCAHLIADNGAIIDDQRDLYDQAFLLLACASRWEAAKDENARVLADNTISFMENELRGENGGWLENCRFELPRRQNPHMHLFEAFTALFRVTSDERYLSYADQIFDLFRTRFFDKKHSVIREFFDTNWTLDPSANIVEPGHMLEWVSLLTAYDAFRDSKSSDICAELYDAAITIGSDPNFYGFVDNKCDLRGSIVHSAKRLWPQTEFLRASIIMASRNHGDASDHAVSIIENFFQTYLNVMHQGLWIDEFDADGRPVSDNVPASILYHIIEAVIAVDNFQRKGQTK
ncbi:AGE family epimerase/isomerase [Hyphococcus lacteus]|uniref:AGE family epimerase/isomerase n=1 Tax=Hyphococcus lacteus TaxID=3143536 RepID=A0ABV3Z425_9PROT